VLIAKRRFDVDHCLNAESSVDKAAQTPNELHYFCERSAVGYGAVCYLSCVFSIHCSLVFERPRVACRLAFCAVTTAFKASRLVARLAPKKLELKDSMGNHGKVREKYCTLPMLSAVAPARNWVTAFSPLTSW